VYTLPRSRRRQGQHAQTPRTGNNLFDLYTARIIGRLVELFGRGLALPWFAVVAGDTYNLAHISQMSSTFFQFLKIIFSGNFSKFFRILHPRGRGVLYIRTGVFLIGIKRMDFTYSSTVK
jgi:hypothetical protein